MSMPTLILPVAGRSSRYPGMRPKWLLTHPRGTLMLTEAIRGLDPSHFGKIVIVALETHEKEYGFRKPILDELTSEYGLTADMVEVVLLKHETRSQPETIYQGIRQAGVKGGVLVKDSDNYFHLPEIPEGNFVAVIDLNKSKPLLVGNKSYVRPSDDGNIRSIVEKQVVSNLFCCGGYYFADAEAFCRHFEALKGDPNLYPSLVIQHMLDAGSSFKWVEADSFEDWGTLKDWTAFKSGYATLFIELDGVVVMDSHRHFEPRWGTTEALRRNAQALNRLYETGKVEIVIISSRKEEQLGATKDQLRKNCVKYHRLVMNLPSGCRRILVSGFSENSPYEAAHAVNLRVNDDRLDEVLHTLIS